MEEVYNIVRQEEDLRTAHKVEEVASMSAVAAFAVQAKGKGRVDDGNKSVFCKHCNRNGHSSDSFFVVIGYPEWWGDRTQARTLQGRNRGGYSNGARRGRGSTSSANAAQVAVKQTEQAKYVITDKDRDGVTGLSEMQWKGIMSILNANSGNSRANTETLTGKCSKPSWILDTGASHHLTGKLDIPNDLHDMEPVLIILADGRERVSVK